MAKDASPELKLTVRRLSLTINLQKEFGWGGGKLTFDDGRWEKEKSCPLAQINHLNHVELTVRILLPEHKCRGVNFALFPWKSNVFMPHFYHETPALKIS